MVGTMAKIDDSVKKKVPELRFKGFTDDWEERKLGDIAPLRGGFAYYDEQDKDDKYILPEVLLRSLKIKRALSELRIS